MSDELTDAEWRAFQNIPEQGYSHRAWVNARIRERNAALTEKVRRETLEEAAEIADSFGMISKRNLEPYWEGHDDATDKIAQAIRTMPVATPEGGK